MIKKLFDQVQKLAKKNKEILELSLELQRKRTQIDLLEAITFDNLIPWIVATTDGTQDNFTVSTVIHIVRKTIRKVTGE